MKEKIREYVPYLVAIIAVLLVKKYLMSFILVKGDSMYPTLKSGDFMILEKVSYKFKDIKRFDIVVVNTDKSSLIKRVIALPFETVEYKDNKLYINGEYIKEDFLDSDIYTNDFTYSRTLGENEYFVLGDNRSISKDSRTFGAVLKSEIEGKAIFTLFPFSSFGSKK